MKFTDKFRNLTFDWKKVLPYVVALTLFIGFALFYCSPVLDGKVVYAGDTLNWQGAAHQTQEYTAQTGESCWWTNSMFSGMPSYQVDAHIPSHKVSHLLIRDTLHFGMHETLGIVFGYLLGFYILLLCFGVNAWLSIAGAFAMGLSTYLLLIIPAGHVTKAIAMGFLPALIGGLHLIFRKKWWLGVPIILVFGMASIVLHPQMTYYIVLLAGVIAIAEIFPYLRNKEWKELGVAITISAICMLLLIGTKVCYLKLNNEYLSETMRGGHSELVQEDEDGNESKETKKTSGLSLKYATDWSYGIDETLTLLVPNMMGGASGYNVGDNSALYNNLVERFTKDYKKQGAPKREAEKYAKQSAHQFCEHAPTYWGDKPFTSGAVYVGAIIVFLFILGLLIVPGPYKWALLFATLMSVFLAWGRNMNWLTEFFFNYFPMYNKFRAVETILIVAEITMPLLGFLGLQRILEGKVDWKRLRNSLFIAGGLTAGLCLVLAIFSGSIFSFTSSYDQAWKGQVDNDIYKMIVDQRQAMLTSDAWRSFAFIMAGFIMLYGFAWLQRSFGNKTKYKIALIVGLIGLILADMIPVNKRFFNNDNFSKPEKIEKHFKVEKGSWEEEILAQEKTPKGQIPNYRVYNMSARLDQDSRSSYRLNSIGGYSAVKLRRYQDLIDAHIGKMNWNVLNMLNTKYIYHPQYGVIPNQEAMGNAWFVNNVQFVPTPNDESNALYTIDIKTTVVADEKFRNVLTCETQPGEEDYITLTKCTPNKLIYSTNVAHDRVAVFSEIYYPHGWHLYMGKEEVKQSKNGKIKRIFHKEKELSIGRVNYVLRAAIIPAGEHTLVMEFVPDGLSRDKLGYAMVIIALLISLGCLTWPLWKKINWKKKVNR